MSKRLICLGMFAAAGWASCATRPDNETVHSPEQLKEFRLANERAGRAILLDRIELARTEAVSIQTNTVGGVCPKHGESDSCLSLYINGDQTDYCALCLKEVIEKAGVHRVVLKKINE